jgi:hypothetical protein
MAVQECAVNLLAMSIANVGGPKIALMAPMKKSSMTFSISD